VVGKLVGTVTITASAGAASATVSVIVTHGAPALLALRTAAAGAASGAAFTTQPVVEVRDAAGNVVMTSTLAVSVALASGGGTLSGGTTVAAVAGVAAFSDLAISGLIGARTLTFSAPGVQAATSSSFDLAAGVASQLAIRTQPVAGTAYAAFTTPAVVEIRDAAGNVTASTAAVVAAIASGGGTLGGSTSVNAVAGVATFTNLSVNGTAGARTLSFASGGLAAVATSSFNVAAAPPAIIGLASTTLSISAVRGTSPNPTDITVTNTGVFPLTNLRAQSTTYNPLVPGNWLSVSFPEGTSAPAPMRLTIASAALAVGTYTAAIVLAGDGATATQTLTVTLTVAAQITNTYGTAANKVTLQPVGAVVSPGLVTSVGGAPTTPDATVTYQSRSNTVATVDATGRITAVAPGQSWVVASSTLAAADSVLIIVAPATGPVLRTDLTTWSYRVGDVISIRIQLDTRGVSVGGVTLAFSWPTFIGNTGISGALTFVDVTAATGGLAPQASLDASRQILRVSGASANGVTGVIDLATIRLRAARAGTSVAYLTAIEVLAADLADLLGTTTSTSYPIIVP
jgi:hypothetical protein